jgi:radical SAM-linked protein
MSQGFTARPRMSFGLGLPTGAESLAEYVDIDLVDAVDDLEGLAAVLSDALPIGYTVTAIALRQPGAVSLQEAVTACSWTITVDGVSLQQLTDAVEWAIASRALPLERERKGHRRVDDVRPVIESAVAAPGGDDDPRPRLEAVLLAAERGLRPTELVAALLPELDPLDAAARILRTEQFIDVEGTRRPVLAPAFALQEDRS